MLPQVLGIGLVALVGVGLMAFAAGFILGADQECPLCQKAHANADHEGILERLREEDDE